MGKVSRLGSGLEDRLPEDWSGDALVRGGAAWDALRGARVGPPIAVRRWPWALTAALAGAVVGAASAVALRAVFPRDAPGAQEPDELQAVVDSAKPPPP